MKTQSDFLFRFIKGLTPSEKRYFKVYAQQKKGKHSIQLFEAIDKQKVYDEGKLKKKLGNTSLTRYFSMAKTRLKQLLLNSLHEYQINATPTEQIRELFQQAWVLCSRGFNKEGAALIMKALKQCEAMESYALAIQISSDALFFKISKHIDYDLKNRTKIDFYLKKLEEENQMDKIYAQITELILIKNQIRHDEDKLFFQKLMQSPVLQIDDSQLTFRSKMSKSMIYYYYFSRIVKDQEKAFERIHSGLLLFNEKKIQTFELANKYYSFLVNYLNACGRLSKYEELKKGIEHLDELSKDKVFQQALVDLEVVTFTQRSRLLLSAYHQQKQYNKSLNLLPSVIEGIHKYQEKIVLTSHISLNWLILMTYWIFERYEEMLDWLNRLFDLKTQIYHNATFSSARILNLVVHYELGNHYYLEYDIGSVNRYLYKRGDLTPLEACIIKYFRKVIYLDNRKHIQALFIAFKQSLIDLLKNRERLIIVELLLIWLDTKIEGCSLKKMATREIAF